MSDDFFLRPDYDPRVYAYEDLKDPDCKNLLKVGEAIVQSVEKRVSQQYPIKRPGSKPYKIVFNESSMRSDGSVFSDKQLRDALIKQGFNNPEGEWMECDIKSLKAAYISLKDRINLDISRDLNFKMRPEQDAAVTKTINYIKSITSENPKDEVHFLWNAKMRFGKTFAAYQLAKKMKWKKVLVLTFKPAVQSAWESDLLRHTDFKDWQFISKKDFKNNNDIEKNIDRNHPLVCFGSFQDYLGKTKIGGIKPKNEWVHAINWDCIIYDEYHYGAWRDKAQDLTSSDEYKERKIYKDSGVDDFDRDLMPITANNYLYLSGTPFRAITEGEFIEDQIFNWTYSDEQKAKTEWKDDNNPYSTLPKVKLLTYRLPPDIVNIASMGEFDEFDLNVFFSTKGKEKESRFIYEDHVQKWLNLIRGSHKSTSYDDLKLGNKKAPFPFSDIRLLSSLSHTFWYLKGISECYAMKNLLEQPQNSFFHDFNILVCAGHSAGTGLDALGPVQAAQKEPLKSKTIVLSCGKLTDGVSVPPWSAVFMLRNLKSPESYFQTAFRAQTPWAIKNTEIDEEIIFKEECYIFDFAPYRALNMIASYANQLNTNDVSEEEKVSEFIKFLPVLAYDGGVMQEVDAAGLLERAMSGTSATLLARKWESDALIHVDNYTLNKLLNDEEALAALMKIEGFRNISDDIEMIINKSEAIKEAKKESTKDESKADTKKVSKEEKEILSKREEIKKKLKKLAGRLPVFMYLTDYREERLKDVITQLDSRLFKKVTSISVQEFEKLVTLGVFDDKKMDKAVGDFKRYENSSLTYSGVSKHKNLKVGLWQTVITSEEHDATI